MRYDFCVMLLERDLNQTKIACFVNLETQKNFVCSRYVINVTQNITFYSNIKAKCILLLLPPLAIYLYFHFISE